MQRTQLLLVIGLACFVATLVGIGSNAFVRGRAFAGGAAIEPGDTNGDGRRDLSDAVYLLEWLFQGGSEPVGTSCPPSASALPATGVERCYDSSGVEVACPSADPPGQDGSYRAGCDGNGGVRFIAGEGGTVIDTCTGLEWQVLGSDAPSLPWDDALRSAENIVLATDGTWQENSEDASEHGGVLHDDWRVPNTHELASLVNYGRFQPAADASLELRSAGYWTSTSSAQHAEQAWCVNFFNGQTEPISKFSPLRVIVVRNADGS